MQSKSFYKKLLLEGSIVRRQGRWRRDQSRHDADGSSLPPLVSQKEDDLMFSIDWHCLTKNKRRVLLRLELY
jgi:hypothetical protein